MDFTVIPKNEIFLSYRIKLQFDFTAPRVTDTLMSNVSYDRWLGIASKLSINWYNYRN